MGLDDRNFQQRSENPAYRALLRLSKLQGKDSVDNLHDGLDRAPAERLSTSHKDARNYAQREVEAAE